MLSDLVGAVSTVQKRPRRNPRRNFPSVAQGEAPVYGELAAMAHAAGYPGVSPAQVHKWVNAGLLPATSWQVSVGRRGFASARRPGVGEQLLALCRLRRETKSWNRLAIGLWIEGWSISIERLKAALLAELPASLDNPRFNDKRLDQLDGIARRRGPASLRQMGLGRVRSTTAAEAAYVAVLIAYGARDAVDETSAEAIRRAAGLARAGVDQPEQSDLDPAGPTLPPFGEFLGQFSVGRVRASVQNASGGALRAARPRARFLVRELPDLVRVADLYGGRAAGDLGGLGVLGRLTPRMPWLAVVVPIVLAEAGFAERFDAIAASTGDALASAPELLRVGEIYRRNHADQLGLIRKIGLSGLAERGLLVPLTLAELAGTTESPDGE